MHMSNATNKSSWACSPYLCASLVQEFWSFSILQCYSLFVNVQLLLLPTMHFHIFVSTSPPLSSISIKDVILIDTKDSIGVDGWYLNLVFFMDTTTYVGMTPLVALEIPHVGSFDLDTNWWDTSPYVIAWVIHLINLSSCRWGMHSSFDDHLWNHCLVWLIPRVEMWYHLKEFASIEPLVGFVNFDHFLNTFYLHEYHL